MNAFTQPFQNAPDALTANGAPTNYSTSNACTDLFAIIGALPVKSRNKTIDPNVIKLFERAVREEPSLALRILLWARDIRGGAGRRLVFRQLLNHLETFYPVAVRNLIPHIATFGRFDDLLEIKDAELSAYALDYLRQQLNNPAVSQLICKWMPRQGLQAVKIRNAWGLTPKQYRKLLVAGTNVVESQMCAKMWSEVEYQKVPSVASIRYSKAFERHDAKRYSDWVNDVAINNKKVNTGAIDPVNVYKLLSQGNVQHAENLWVNLPNYVPPGTNMLPVVDLSGSMMAPVQGSITAMDVSISLGTYLANKNTGSFANLVLGFAENPKFIKLSGKSFQLDSQNVRRGQVGYTTNLQAVYDAILNHAVSNAVPQQDMPQYILMISDMEFNTPHTRDVTNHQAIVQKFKNSGYELPRLVYWNVAARIGNVPVKVNENNAALVSGYSTALLKAVLSNDIESFTPRSVLEKTVNVPRYLDVVPQF